MRYATGLIRSDPGKHAMSVFAPTSAVPNIPQFFGHFGIINDWHMLANDRIGNCTVAGADHVEMLWNRMKNEIVVFTTTDAREDYFAQTGGRDTGLQLTDVANYWQHTGMRDALARRYKIAAWRSIEGSESGAPNLQHALYCAYLYEACGIGMALPGNADDMFESGDVWDVTSTQPDKSGGYHYVPVVGRGEKGIAFVTWGALRFMTERFFNAMVYEGCAYLSAADAPNATLFRAAT
jgi:hypothetical protein